MWVVGGGGEGGFGGHVLNHLESSGVDTEQVRTELEAGSGMSVAIIDAEGDYGAVIVSGANLRLSNEDLQEAQEVIRDAQVLVLQNEVPEAANVAAAKLAKGYGVRVILNAAPARPLRPDLAANIDLLVVNAVEAELICGG